MATVSVRYIVHDVDAAIAFYCDDLDFTEVMHPAPAFAMLSRGDLRLVLSAPGGGPGGGQAMPDGAVPEPGGWNRFSIEVADLAATVSELRRKGVRFRNEIVTGVGGKQILAVDPSGNLVELFEPVLPEAQLSQPSLARPWPDHGRLANSRIVTSARVLGAVSTYYTTQIIPICSP
jgi:catechol 2,3-dioxygenase-like lactoylglutathione lyase family enzyme